MQKLILILVFMFALTGSYANNFSNNELKNSFIENVSIESSIDTINNFGGLKNIRIIIVIEDKQCTVTITGSVDVGVVNVDISVSATAETCEEAASAAVKGVVTTIKKVKDALL